jgi:predicted Zn finger-like uncharacterized protein
MRIACPACSAVYDVPEKLLSGPKPRALRCAQCGHSWTPAPSSPAPVAEPPAPAAAVEDAEPAESTELRPPPIRTPRYPSPIEPPLRPPPRGRPGERMLVVLGWLLSFAVLGAGGWAAVVWRAEVVEAWPPAARLYVALGLEV